MGGPGGADFPIVFDVNINASYANKILGTLKEGGYFDRSTSSSTLSLILLNLESDLITLVVVTATRQPEGGIAFGHTLTLLDPSPYSTSDDWGRLAIELTFITLLVGMLGIEMQEIAAEMKANGHPLGYFNFFNCCDMLGYLLRVVLVGVWIDYVKQCANFEPKAHYKVYADDQAVGRILKVNANIVELQGTFAQVQQMADSISTYETLCAISIVVMVIQLVSLSVLQRLS